MEYCNLTYRNSKQPVIKKKKKKTQKGNLMNSGIKLMKE